MPSATPKASAVSTGASLVLSLIHIYAHFKTTSDRECLGAMMWHHAIASSAWPLISVVEICLRNRSHHAMSALYGNVKSREWYRGGPNDMRLKGGIQGRITELLYRTCLLYTSRCV